MTRRASFRYPRSQNPPRRTAPAVLAALLFGLLLLAFGALPAAAQGPLVPDGPHVDVGGVGDGVAPGAIDLEQQRPRVLMDSEGGFVVFWFEAEKDPARPRLLARRFDADGTPLWQEREYWDPVDGVEVVGGFDDVAMNAAGDFVIAWDDPQDGVHLRVFDACGDPLGPVVEVGLGPAPPGTTVVGVDFTSVALSDEAVAIVGWVQVVQEPDQAGDTFEAVVAQRVRPDGAFVEPFHRVAADSSVSRLEVTAGPAGGYAVAAELPTVDPAAGFIQYVQFDADGVSVPTPPLPPNLPNHPSQEHPAVAASPTGGYVLAFEGGTGQGPDGVDGSCSGVFARFEPIASNEIRVNPVTQGCQGAPQAAGMGNGWIVSWSGADADPVFGTDGSGQGVYVTVFGADFQPGGDPVPVPIRVLSSLGGPYDLAAGGGQAAVATVLPDPSGTPRVVVQRLSPPGSAACTSDLESDHLCLQGDRFRVDGDWRSPYEPGNGPAYARAVREDSGALWFFRQPNLELLVKVLDGRGVDGNWWVFYGALSTVEYWVTVTDLELGRQNVYYNPPFVQASVADTVAFEGVLGGGGAATAQATAGPLVLPDSSARELTADGLAFGALTPATCDGDPLTLCLQGDEFHVTVEWHDPRSGNRGSATRAAITPDTGAFWFFDEDNLDLMVKVLDGRPVNGHWWVLYGSLSNVEYTIRVVRRLEGGGEEEVVYENAPGELRSGADTTAFDG